MKTRHFTLVTAAVAGVLAAAPASAVEPVSTHPKSPNESNPTVSAPLVSPPASREDNPRIPNPVTPSAANESAPQPRGLSDPTNATGMEGRPRQAIGATSGEVNRGGSYEAAPRPVIAPAPTSTDTVRSTPPAAAGSSTLPSRNVPASVSESAPQRTGKEVSSAPVPDDKNMPNPKTPANVSESKPDNTGKNQMGVGGTR
jgi:hypothetical protein